MTVYVNVWAIEAELYRMKPEQEKIRDNLQRSYPIYVKENRQS